MIDGITILNQTEITEFGLWATPVGFLVFAIIVIGFGILTEFEGWSAIIGSVIGLIVWFFIFASSEESTGRYKYECLIDENVSMTEVHEKYEVIEQRGDIWVLEDKEQ